MNAQKLLTRIYIRIQLVSLFIFIGTAVFAQINIKVGYTGGYATFESTNMILNQYNTDNTAISQKFSELHFLHGLELGGRYKFGSIGIDAGITLMRNDTKATGIINPDGGKGDQEIGLSVINYHLGLESHFGFFGIGTNIGYQNLKYKKELFGDEGKIYSEYQLGSKFYLILELPGESSAISLRPYISTVWDAYNITQVANNINDNTVNSINESPFIYGLSILFYNGRQ
ncbi:MAG: hypothetical protein V3V14_07050 [Saprospiraceae bacterium]